MPCAAGRYEGKNGPYRDGRIVM